MRRVIVALAVLSAFLPAGALFAAVATTPPSASALPAFEIAAPGKPIRVTSGDLGLRHTGSELRVDEKRFAYGVNRLQTVFGKRPRPGSYELRNGRIVLKPGVPGVAVDAAATRRLLLRAVQGERSNLALPTRLLEPRAPPTYAIVVSLRDFRLDLYRGTNIVEHFSVGVGQLRFPTPPGAYYIRSKQIRPSWHNPGSRWARDMPVYIPPGSRNPLGTRAMRLDRGSLVIHGTPQPWTIGRRASHGCIRMRRADVEHLYGIVPLHTPVFIVP